MDHITSRNVILNENGKQSSEHKHNNSCKRLIFSIDEPIDNVPKIIAVFKNPTEDEHETEVNRRENNEDENIVFDELEESRDSISSETSPSKTPLSIKLKNMKLKLNLKYERNALREDVSNNDSFDFSTSFDELSSTPTRSVFDEFYKHYRDKEITEELSLYKNHQQDGVYITPSVMSLQIWFGVIFIRDGLYDEGIFHFTIYFTDEFPSTRPVLRFKSKVFHPQIEPKKGTLSLDSLYTNSKNKRVHVWEIVRQARSSFYQLDVNGASNNEAALLFHDNFTTFKARCRSSVLDSLLEYEERRHQDAYEAENPLKCALLDDELYNCVKTLLKSKNNLENNKGIFLWARNQLGKVLNNITYYTANESSEEVSVSNSSKK